MRKFQSFFYIRFKYTFFVLFKGQVKEKDTLIDKLLKDSKTNITKIDEKGKEA